MDNRTKITIGVSPLVTIAVGYGCYKLGCIITKSELVDDLRKLIDKLDDSDKEE